MFSLVITLISVALVSVLAVTAIFYGGHSWTTGMAKTKAAQLSSEADQLIAAVNLFRVDNKRLPTSLAELTAAGKYLTSVPPSGWEGSSTFFQFAREDLDKDICLAFNAKRGIPFVPPCSDELYRSTVVCCEAPPPQ